MLVPLIAWNLTGVPSRSKAITIDGLEVGAIPGPNTYGVEPSSISVHEAGPGQVSSMHFEITDPTGLISIAQGQFVRFDDRALNLPIFAGWVENYAVSPLGIGRLIEVDCIGVETILDWAYVPAFTLLSGQYTFISGFQAIIAAATGLGVPLRAAADEAGFGLCEVATPVGPGFLVTGGYDITVPGGSLRQSLQTYGDALWGQVDGGAQGDIWAFTVDFYLGVRVFSVNYGQQNTSVNDYGVPTLSTTAANKPSGTRHGFNGSGTPRGVYVKGSGAGTGLVPDGSGIPGPVGVVTNANSTTAVRKQAIGESWLSGRQASYSGSVTAEGGVTLGTFGTQNRAGSFIALKDPQAGIPVNQQFFIQAIDKTFYPSGEEWWTFSYGGTVPRGSSYLRALTSGQLI